ncbi:hypothetical protein D3C75_1358740 [compost metagenome]
MDYAVYSGTHECAVPCTGLLYEQRRFIGNRIMGQLSDGGDDRFFPEYNLYSGGGF